MNNFNKSKQASSMAKSNLQIKCVYPKFGEAADIGSVPPSERTIDNNEYSKVASLRRKDRDTGWEQRTETYINGTYLRSR